MNSTEKPKSVWTRAWPDRRGAIRRLSVITSIVFPLSWAVNALLIGNWDLLDNRDAESMRHLIEWTFICIATVAVVFLASLLSGPRRFFSRFNARRWIFSFVCFVTLVALF